MAGSILPVFRFRNLDYGKELQRTTAVNMRSRIMFETDVVNDYFSRGRYPGEHALRLQDQALSVGPIPDHTLNLHDGAATLNLALPADAEVGDSYQYELVVSDETLAEPFVNPFVISVGPHQEPAGGNSSRRPRNSSGDGDEGAPQGLALPTPFLVYEREWEKYGFDRNSALKAIYDVSDGDENASGSHTYYINMDNVYLNTELKVTKVTPEILKARWQYGMVIVGMALLRTLNGSDTARGAALSAEDKGMTPEEEVAKATAAIAPVLLPLIEHLGALSDEDLAS